MAERPADERPSATDAELVLLEILWQHGPSTVRELHGRLRGDRRQWAYTTVQTLLRRLEEKGFVAVDRSGFAHRFRAAVSRDDLLGRELSGLAERLCGGAAAPLLRKLVEANRFRPEELRRFRQILDAAAPREEDDA